MKIERDFLVQKLKDAGVHGKIHGSMKSLKLCKEIQVGAVLRVNETFGRSSSKRKFTDQEGRRRQRRKLFDRITTLHVVIADSDEEKVEKILTEFLKNISKGLSVDDNWVSVEVGDADWVEEEDSILRSKIAVEFDITMIGGIYIDTDIKNVELGNIDVTKKGGTEDGRDEV